MRKFFNKKLFISQYMLKSACEQCLQEKLACKIMVHISKLTAKTMTVFFAALYKNRDSFLRLRGFQYLIFIYAASLQSFPALWQSEHH